MARADSGHETVTSEDEDRLTPKHSPAFLLGVSCEECQLQHRRFPITSEEDLYRVTACTHAHTPPLRTGHQHSSLPPKLTDILHHAGKAIIRPIACKPSDDLPRLQQSRPPYSSKPQTFLIEAGLSENGFKRSSVMLKPRLGGSLSSVLVDPPSPATGLRRTGSAFCVDAPGRTSTHHSLPVQLLPSDVAEWVAPNASMRPNQSTPEHEFQSKGLNKSPTCGPEMKHLEAMHVANLRAAQQKAIKLEQALATTSCQLQQERRKFRAQLDESVRKRQQCDRINFALAQELDGLRTQLEEVEWSLCRKTGEMALLKAQLKDSHGDQATRSHEMAQLKSTLKGLEAEAAEARSELAQCTLSHRSVERESMILRQSLLQEQSSHKETLQENCLLRRKLQEMDLNHSVEASVWQAEKANWAEQQTKVLRYQKALQHNYILASQKAQSLAFQLESLGINAQPQPNCLTSTSNTDSEERTQSSNHAQGVLY